MEQNNVAYKYEVAKQMKQGANTKVLIIDDDPLVLKKLTEELKRRFFEPIGTLYGKEALEIIEREGILLVLLDVKLPDVDGLEVLSQIKKKKPECEIIVITGYGTLDIAITALRLGAIDYIEKPINLQILTAALGRADEKISASLEKNYCPTLLLVDDDLSILILFERFLKKEGYQVFVAGAGKEALDFMVYNKIDIVISDVMMEDMDGIEVCKRAKELYPDIECILVTGHRHSEVAVKALRVGVYDYLTKPVDLNEMLVAIERAYEKINLNRTRLYRDRELKISSEIISKMNEDLEKRISERSCELANIQSQLFQTSKLATLGEMSAGLAHEMNQPLGAISLVSKSFKKLLTKDKLTREEIEEGIADIDFSVDRMVKVIQHIRTFARQEAMKFLSVDVNATIENALTLLGEQLRLHSIDIMLACDPDLPRIAGEPYHLEQVWVNILANARDAMDEKEKVEPGFEKKLKIITACEPDTKEVKISFIDNGPGIPLDIRDKVLEPFFTTKEVGKGVGLGLSISYGIIDEHKGRILVKSEDRKGTVISVLLPQDMEAINN
jgi:two-component system, NtrC family, sensor kinase